MLRVYPSPVSFIVEKFETLVARINDHVSVYLATCQITIL